jgi:hypothetical protein
VYPYHPRSKLNQVHSFCPLWRRFKFQYVRIWTTIRYELTLQNQYPFPRRYRYSEAKLGEKHLGHFLKCCWLIRISIQDHEGIKKHWTRLHCLLWTLSPEFSSGRCPFCRFGTISTRLNRAAKARGASSKTNIFRHYQLEISKSRSSSLSGTLRKVSPTWNPFQRYIGQLNSEIFQHFWSNNAAMS